MCCLVMDVTLKVFYNESRTSDNEDISKQVAELIQVEHDVGDNSWVKDADQFAGSMQSYDMFSSQPRSAAF